MANFPSSQLTGIPKNRFYAEPPDYEKTTDEWEYEDGGKDRNEVSDTAIRRWEYVYDGLTPEQAAQFDTFNDTVRRAYPFTFLDKYDNAWSNVYIEDYKRTHEAHKSWIIRVEFNLVGENSQILTPPTVSLTDIDLVSGDVVVTGTVSESCELRLFINNDYHSIQTDNGSFTFSVPVEDLVYGINSFKVTALNAVGAFATSNPLTYTKESVPPSVTITLPEGGDTVSGTITITATASDNIAVDRVEFYYYDGEGFALIAIDSSAPYSVNFDTSEVPNGDLILGATAFDTSENSTDALFVTVTVENLADFLTEDDGDYLTDDEGDFLIEG